MAAFHNLSEELILETLSYLENDKQTLMSLTISSKHLCRISRLYLYKNVRLDIFSKGFKQFAQVIKIDETLPPLVRSLTLSMSTSSLEEVLKNEAATQALQTLLSRLYRLETLDTIVQINAMRRIDEEFSFRPMSPKCRCSLTIRGSPSMREVLHLVHQYRPHVLNLARMPFQFGFSPLPTAQYLSAYWTVPLESLNLGGYHCLQTGRLNCLLKWPIIRTLKCTATQSRPLTDLGPASLRWLSWVVGSLKPSRISHSLRPVVTSLEKLQLQTANMPWCSHDGSRLDLSSFVKLKHLDLASDLLFDSPEPSPKRNGTYALLPAALEELIVIFDFGNHIITSQVSQEGTNPIDYAWLFEIAAHKSERYPKLRHASLIEIAKKPRAPRIPCEVCPLPGDLKQAFQTAAIELSTRRRIEEHEKDFRYMNILPRK
ncbi:MAG: hypothetical protein Q9160_000666 [Pyrenula sp. 1 TL-2023]